MPAGRGPASVEVQNVTFTYPERHLPVLNGINLKVSFQIIKPWYLCFRECLCQLFLDSPWPICGFRWRFRIRKIHDDQPNRTVSTSESSEIYRDHRLTSVSFYDVSSGSIVFDGKDISTVDAKSYRENLSLVAQESTLYEGTIRDNIALSVEEPLATDNAIEEACTTAQIHDFITSLPNGKSSIRHTDSFVLTGADYNTYIGTKGVALSGGQRQRIALARALLRRPQLLLLDEATSNLDSESEKLVQIAIEQVAGSQTVIAIAHRLATIRNADIIFVFGSGTVLESGNHTSLLAQRGVYYQMVCMKLSLDIL
jgi:ABC-type multidrug transport system fused ATPase/permease subunit